MLKLTIFLGVLLLLSNGYTLSSAVLTQTTPSYTPVCPGDRLIVTCVTNGTAFTYWRYNSTSTSARIESYGTFSHGVLSLSATNISGTTINSTGTIESVTVSMNGTMISCSPTLNANDFDTFIINIRDPPVSVSITINPINSSTAMISWIYKNDQCITSYIYFITELSDDITYNISGITQNHFYIDLIIGSNYSFTIIPIDTAGIEEPPSSSIQYIWDVPVQVVNVSWDQISNDSIIIWWNNIEDSRPPTDYYNITVYNTTDCINSCIVYSDNVTDTNITIAGLSPTINYTVTIIPVNIIGYGPSVNVSISISSNSSSSESTSTLSSPVTTAVTDAPSITYTNSLHSSMLVSLTGTIPLSSTINTSTPPSSITTIITSTVTTATGSGAVPVIAGAIGGIVLLIIIIIIIVIVILVYTRRHSGLKKESHTANGNTDEKSAGVSGESWRKNNFELSPPAGPTDPTYATPTTEYTPAPPVRHIQGGDGPPLYPPPPPGGQYSVLRGDDDDDDIPPPVPPAYNPDGVQEYSVLKREGEKKSQQPLPQGATPLYSTLNQTADTPPPVPAYNPDGVQDTQDYSVLKREEENESQQALPVPLYSTINKDQGQVDESAHKLVYADLSIASKDKRPQPPPTNEQAVLYASVNNQVQSKAPPPVPPPQDKVLYADLSVAGKRTPRAKPRTQPAEDRVLYAAVNGNGINRKSTTHELLMAQIGDLDIPPPIPPKPKP